MGCTMGKQTKQVVFQDHRTHQANSIRIEKKLQGQVEPQPQQQSPQDRQINTILSPIHAPITHRKPAQVLQDIVKLSDLCIEHYTKHEIDQAYEMLVRIQRDVKELEERGFRVEMNEHFKQEFIELSHRLRQEYEDMLGFDEEILRGGWKLQKDKKNFKVYSRVQDNTVGIRLQSVLQVPFENFIAVMIQPDHYKQFLPFIRKSSQLKTVQRNCKLGFIEMSFPILSNRQAYFQGVVYNRLNNAKKQQQQLFMYTRSIHNRQDLQEQFKYEVKVNPKCVQLDYKYLVVKYVPLSDDKGKLVMGVNIDLKLNLLPLYILQMVSISFSEDFFGNIVRISKKFEGSIWDQGIKENPDLFEFTKKAKNQYLAKQRAQSKQ